MTLILDQLIMVKISHLFFYLFFRKKEVQFNDNDEILDDFQSIKQAQTAINR
jgi:hypothetical protein